MENQQQGRRSFIKKSAAALALMGLGLPSFGHIQNKQTLKVALIGCGWYGKMDLWRLIQIANVEVVALCDVDQNHLAEANTLLKNRFSGHTPSLYKDYRDLFKSHQLDITIIGTPDHWHALQAIAAMKSGSHIYLQKPIAVDRFNASVKRAIDLHLLRNENKEDEGEHIFIKSNLKKLKVYTSKIKWIEAFGDYVRVVTEDDSNLVLSTMKSFENDLSKDKFIRVHKTYIINIDKVERFNSKFAEIVITKIPLSRNKKEDLVKALSTSS